MCDATALDPTGFWGSIGVGPGQKKPEMMKPVPPPKPPTASAERVYGARRSGAGDDEPQLLGTSALRIPLKTIQ